MDAMNGTNALGKTVAVGEGKAKIWTVPHPLSGVRGAGYKGQVAFAATDKSGAFIGRYTTIEGARNVGWGEPPSKFRKPTGASGGGAGFGGQPRDERGRWTK